jgi:hypothetical protein
VPTDTPSGDALAALLASLEDAVRTGDCRRIKEAMDSLGRIDIEVRCMLPAASRDSGTARAGEQPTPPNGAASDT